MQFAPVSSKAANQVFKEDFSQTANQLPLKRSESDVNMRCTQFAKKLALKININDDNELGEWIYKEQDMNSPINFLAYLECNDCISEKEKIKLAWSWIRFNSHLNLWYRSDLMPDPSNSLYRRIYLLALGLFLRAQKHRGIELINLTNVLLDLKCSDYQLMGTHRIIFALKLSYFKNDLVQGFEQEIIWRELQQDKKQLYVVIQAIMKSRDLVPFHGFLTYVLLNPPLAPNQLRRILEINKLPKERIRTLARVSFYKHKDMLLSEKILEKWMHSLFANTFQTSDFKKELAVDSLWAFWGQQDEGNLNFNICFMRSIFNTLSTDEKNGLIDNMINECQLKKQTILLLLVPYFSNTSHYEESLNFINKNSLDHNEWFKELVKVEKLFHSKSSQLIVNQIRSEIGSEMLITEYAKIFKLTRNEFYLCFRHLLPNEQTELMMHLKIYRSLTNPLGLMLNRMTRDKSLYFMEIVCVIGNLIKKLSKHECRNVLKIAIRNCNKSDFQHLLSFLLPIATQKIFPVISKILIQNFPDIFWILLSKSSKTHHEIEIIKIILTRRTSSIKFMYEDRPIYLALIRKYFLACRQTWRSSEGRWSVSQCLNAVSFLHTHLDGNEKKWVKNHLKTYFIPIFKMNLTENFSLGLAKIRLSGEDLSLNFETEETAIFAMPAGYQKLNAWVNYFVKSVESYHEYGVTAIRETYLMCIWLRENKQELDLAPEDMCQNHINTQILSDLMNMSDQEFALIKDKVDKLLLKFNPNQNLVSALCQELVLKLKSLRREILKIDSQTHDLILENIKFRIELYSKAIQDALRKIHTMSKDHPRLLHMHVYSIELKKISLQLRIIYKELYTDLPEHLTLLDPISKPRKLSIIELFNQKKAELKPAIEEADPERDEACALYNAVNNLKFTNEFSEDDRLLKLNYFISSVGLQWEDITWMNDCLNLKIITNKNNQRYEKDFASFGIRSFTDLKDCVTYLKNLSSLNDLSKEQIKSKEFKNIEEIKQLVN